jgi:hypothetical protein
VALLERTISAQHKAMSVLWYRDTNQLFKCKGVTVGNMENKRLQDSPSSDGWNNFNRQVVSCIRRAHNVTGTFYFQEKAVKSRNHLDVLELSSVSQMAHLQPNVFFQQDGVPPD